MGNRFEKVSKFAAADFNLPVRKTTGAAGYDFEVAEDIVVPSYEQMMYDWKMKDLLSIPELESTGLTKEEILDFLDKEADRPHSLTEIATLTKSTKAKPTLVPTGVKCYLDPGCYLELSVRSSTPLKYWLILANGVGIIDRDYADNVDNEGHIYFQVINLSHFPIQLHKGDIIGQGIIKRYETVEGDEVAGLRTGGFGSTSEQRYPSYSLEQKEQLRKEGKI